MSIRSFYRFFLVTLGSAFSLAAPLADSAVITPSGTFVSCAEAVAFRDGELVGAADEQFGRYDRGVQGRVAQVVAELEQHRDKMHAAYLAADKKHTAAIRNAVVRFAFYEALGKIGGKMVPGKALEGIDKTQQAVLKHVAERSAVLAGSAADAGFTGNAPLDPMVKQNFELFLTLAPKAKHLVGPVGSAVILGAELGLDVAKAHMETALDVREAKAERDALRAAIDKMITESPKEKLRRINETRSIIDARCSGDDGLGELEDFVDAAGKEAAPDPDAGDLEQELDAAQRGYDRGAEGLRRDAERAQTKAATDAFQSGLEAFDAMGRRAETSGSQGCQANPAGRAPRHCCQLVTQQIAIYEQDMQATSDAQYRQKLDEGIRLNRQWYNRYCG